MFCIMIVQLTRVIGKIRFLFKGTCIEKYLQCQVKTLFIDDIISKF